MNEMTHERREGRRVARGEGVLPLICQRQVCSRASPPSAAIASLQPSGQALHSISAWVQTCHADQLEL